MEEQKIYELELAQYVRDKAKLEAEIKKLNSVVIGQCTKFMIEKLKELQNTHLYVH
jgi:cell division protein FtsB